MEDRCFIPTLAVAVLIIVVAGGTGWYFRYGARPSLPNDEGGFVRLWDRIGQRECVTTGADASAVRDIACTPREITALQTKVQSEHDVEWRKIVAIAGGQPSGGASVARLRATGFARQEVGAYVASVRAKFAAAGVSQALSDEYFGGAPGAEMLPDPPPPR